MDVFCYHHAVIQRQQMTELVIMVGFWVKAFCCSSLLLCIIDVSMRGKTVVMVGHCQRTILFASINSWSVILSTVCKGMHWWKKQQKKKTHHLLLCIFHTVRHVFIFYNIYISYNLFQSFQRIVQSVFRCSFRRMGGSGVEDQGVEEIREAKTHRCLTLLISAWPQGTEDCGVTFNPVDVNAIQTGTIWRPRPWCCSLIGLPW